MRIVAALHGYPPRHMAGAEVMAHAILKWLAARGHECLVLTDAHMLGGPEEGVLDGVRVRCVVTKDEEEAHYREADVVFTHLDLTRRTVNLAKRLGRPVAHLVHNHKQLGFWKVTSEEAALVVYNSRWLAREVNFPAPSVIVHPPLFLEDYEVDVPAAEASCYTLSNLNENKGGRIFWWLAREFPERRFLGIRGAYDEQILGELPNVEVAPQTSDIREYLRRTRVQLVPSRIETWGRAAIEAAAAGRPIIANPTKGLREALGPDGALWVAREDHLAWGRALEVLDDPAFFADQAQAARRRAVELAEISQVQLTGLEAALISVAAGTRSRVFAVLQNPVEVEHVAPVLCALRPEQRGLVLGSEAAWTEAAALGLPSMDLDKLERTVGPSAEHHARRSAAPDGSVCLVASHAAQVRARRALPVPRVRMEAGAGQTYPEKVPELAGGPDSGDVLAWLSPGPEARVAVQTAYPGMPVFLVGSPRLDKWRGLHAEPGEPGVVALSFRHPPERRESAPIPELHGNLAAYSRVVADLQGSGRTLLVTSHPRWEAEFWDLAQLAGLRFAKWDEVMRRASVLVCDNSSAGFEFRAVTHRPVVWVDLPKYRSYLHPGMRFWDLAEVHVQPEQVAKAVEEALETPPGPPEWLEHGAVYSVEEGASKAAAEAVTQLLRPEDESQALVQVVETCMGEFGLLSPGTAMWIPAERAAELESRGLVRYLRRSGKVPAGPSSVTRGPLTPALREAEAWLS